MPKTRAPQPIRKPAKQWIWPFSLWQSAVGRKWIMALTGLGLLGFVFAHMIGNLHLYEGPLAVFDYAEVLREIGAPVIPHSGLLWAMRLGLIAMFGLHIAAAVSLRNMSVAARGTNYQSKRDYVAVSFASRTMRWTGIIVALFILFHLFDLTWGQANPDFVAGDPYHNVVASFQRWWVAIIYVLANLALGFHIYHGAWSMFQSLGVNSPKINRWRRWFASAFAIIIVVGNVSFPLMVQAGVIGDDDNVPVVEKFDLEIEGADA